ncbi:HEAT repeat domain-containing protein, partial [Acinetobacter baumannii]
MAGGRPIIERIDSARSGDPKVRRASVAKLGNVGEANPDAYAAVVEALHDKDANVRCEAIVSLLKFGDAAREKLTEVE